jgi:hypothetical protein
MQPVSSTVSLIILAASTSHNSSSHKRGQLFIRTRNETLKLSVPHLLLTNPWDPKQTFGTSRFLSIRKVAILRHDEERQVHERS